MQTPNTSQFFESYVPLYDTVPEKFEDTREFLVEHLKKVSEGINVRVIGWYLDEISLTGKQFIPVLQASGSNSGDSQQFRSILRKVIDFSPLLVGVNTRPHGILVDVNFTLISLWAGTTNSVAFTGNPIPNGGETISYDATNIIITATAAKDRAFAIIEFMQEI